MEIETNIISEENNFKYTFPKIIINDVIIEIDSFEILYIDIPENYTQEQLKIFDYDIQHKSYILTNYYFKTNIPLNIIDKKTKKLLVEYMIIEMENKNSKNTQKIRLFDKESNIYGDNFLDAFEKLYKEINKDYVIKICTYCKKSCWNPYGGSDFINQLCFNKFSEEYYKIDTKDKMNISKLMNDNDKKYKQVCMVDSCNEYVEK
jgi:hypothetical protein